jgi:hypothetical protein
LKNRVGWRPASCRLLRSASRVATWQALRDALLELARTAEAAPGQASPFGLKFEIRATLQGPSGRQANVVTVWMVSNAQDFPHFVTAHPG